MDPFPHPDGIAVTVRHHPDLGSDLLEAVVTAERSGPNSYSSALVTAAATALETPGLREPA
jgi:hypothetical protein